ncbi:MAG TPA: serine/threonine-protein kinase, partial [Thermoleophilaceae bacterium]|nr:serine/threonine-protein kinase [Thermoleophilaceae bacterium]
MTHPIGRYEVVGELGRGGMATVHLARQLDLGRLVALKELQLLDRADPSAAQRFLREARMAGSLSHPNIVTVYEYFEQGGTPYIAMEHVDGGSLRPQMAEHLSLAQIGGVLEGLLAGLAHAERQGVVHRDVKPENVLVTTDGRIKITD